ncbi:hypothetical protein B5E95_06660 [Lactobacillus gallinarum]|nr:hypothetical protein B5E95_06660 [Lactobacillus gallinarum]
MNLLNLIKTFCIRTKDIFKYKRIKRYGFKYTLLEFIILCCHRSNTKFEHIITRQKDMLIDKYLRKNYSDIIDKYFEK